MSETDQELKVRFLRRLDKDSSVDSADITVEVAGGEVRLSGTVNSLFEKKEAALIAWSVRGVTGIDNRLDVYEGEGGSRLSDAEIVDKTGTALNINVQTSELYPEISVANGVVTVSGTVDTLWRLKKVEFIISGIPGVRDVHNLMTVVPTKSITDEIIAEAIVEAFSENPYIDEEKIFATVAKGKVTLEGKVLSAKSVMEAHDSASRIIGITNVTNKIIWG